MTTTAATTIPELERTTGATIAMLVAEVDADPATGAKVEQAEEKVEP